MKKLRKFLVVSVMVVSTIFMAGGLSFGSTANAAAASNGDLIKMAGLSSVYYLGADGKRYVFPNSTTYFSWYPDFSGVVTIPASELQSYPLGGNVTMRAGTKLVKITTDPSVYAVSPDGVLHKIANEAQASALYGSNWAKRVVDVPDAFFTNYTIGSPLADGAIPAGSLVKNAGSSNVYYYDGSNYSLIPSDMVASSNHFDLSNAITVSATITASGSVVTSGQFSNVAQKGGSNNGNVSTASGLMVSLNANTPIAAAVPSNAVNVPFTKVNFTASADGPVTINNIVFTRTGIGSASDFSGVYLYDGTTRLTNSRSVNSSTNKVNFNGLDVVIPAGQTKTLTLTADISSTGNNNAFSIASASDVTSTGASITGSFPITGNTMNIVAQSTGGITIAETGSPSNPKVGETGVLVAQFTLAASSVEDLSVSGLTLYQSGTISNANISNFVLKQAGTVVATASGVNSNNNVVFSFNSSYNLDKGTTKTFDVYADINGLARSDDTVKLYLDNDADLLAIGKTYGYGVAVTRSAYDGTTGNISSVILQAGQMTIAFQGPATTDYATQDTDVELFRFNMTSQSNVEIRKISLNLDAASTGATISGQLIDSSGSSNVANYTNIKFVDATTGALIAGPMDVSTASGASDTSQTLNFTDVWNMSAGETKTIKVVADIANFTPGTSETIKATLNAFGASDIKNLDNNTFVTSSDIVPSGAIVGNTMNVKAGSVTLSLAGTPTAQTYINGTSDVPVTGINIAAGTGKDVTVTSLKLTAAGVSSCAAESDCILTVKLFDGSTQVGDTKSLASDNTVTFNNLTLNIPKGNTKTLVAKVALNTLSSVNSGTTIALNVANTSDVVAQDSNGNSVSVAGTITGNPQKITDAGTLNIAQSAPVIGETDSRLVVAGTNNQPIASFKFTAHNEALKLSKVRIRIQKEDAGGATSSAATEIANVSLWNGATQITNASVPFTSDNYAIVDFNSTLNDFIVPKDGSADLTVKVSYNTISVGSKAGAKLIASIDGTNNFEFRGVNNSNTVISSGTTVAGNPVYLYKSIPTISNVALPTSVLAAGNQVLTRFTVTADAQGNIDWRAIKFNVTPSNATATGFTLVDENNNVVATTSNIIATSSVTTEVSFTFATDNQVAAGTSKTYTLKADLTVGTDSASVSTKINRTNSFANEDSFSNASSTSFTWSDEAVVGHTVDSSDYNTDFLVKNLPTDSQTLSK